MLNYFSSQQEGAPATDRGLMTLLSVLRVELCFLFKPMKRVLGA